MPDFAKEKIVAAKAARALLATNDFIIADTETDGLHNAEACQFAIIDHEGNTMLDTLCQIANPARLMEYGGGKRRVRPFDIHGISPEMLLEAPTFEQVAYMLAPCLADQRLVVYNLDYDWPIIERMHISRNLAVPKPRKSHCAMKMYAQFCGAWSDYHQSYTFQPLPAIEGVKAHNALGDCLSTLALIKKMAEFEG